MVQTINNKKDLEIAWFFVHYAEGRLDVVDNRKKSEEKIMEYKKAIREYNHKQEKISDYYINLFNADEYGYTQLVKLPENIQTKADAENFYKENIERDFPVSLWSDSYAWQGESYTYGHKICYRQGRFYIYYSTNFMYG